MPKKKSSATSINARFEVIRTIVAIFISLAIVMLIVLAISDEPFVALHSLLIGPLTSMKRFANVIELMIPLTFTGLAISIVFKTQRFNLAADSAFFLGSMVALLVGLFSPFPAIITIILALVAAMLAGSLVGFIPAIIRNRFGANELVTSLMLNYVVGFFVNYIFNYKVRDPQKSSMQSIPLPKDVHLGKVIANTRIHWGLFIMIGVVILSWVILYRTKWGYQLRVTGSNDKFARYSGMKVSFIVIVAQALGTGIAGLGGAVEMLGIHKTFRWRASPGYGFDGVIISTLARGNPALVPLAAFFISYIRVGADILNRSASLPSEIVAIIQAMIILLVGAQSFLAKSRHRALVKQTGALEGGQAS